MAVLRLLMSRTIRLAKVVKVRCTTSLHRNIRTTTV